MEFDFSNVVRTPKINDSLESLREEIDRGLLVFNNQYTGILGKSFASAISAFKESEPVAALAKLINTVDSELEGVQNAGKKDNPLWDVQGVSLFQTTTHYNIS